MNSFMHSLQHYSRLHTESYKEHHNSIIELTGITYYGLILNTTCNVR